MDNPQRQHGVGASGADPELTGPGETDPEPGYDPDAPGDEDAVLDPELRQALDEDPAADLPALEGEIVPGGDTPGDNEELARTVAELTAEDLAPAERRRLLGRLVAQAGRSGWRLLSRPRSALRWITDTVVAAAPRVPIRDLDTLRRHYHGLDGDALAERLIRNASRVTAGVGAAGGGLSSVEWAAPPTLLTAPVLLSAETVAVVAVEMKLIGELHEVYRMPIAGTGTDRAGALLAAWAGRRGVSLKTAARGLGASMGLAARRELRDRLLRRFGRNLTTLGPLLTGAAVGAEMNRRATRAVGKQVRADLRKLAEERMRESPPPPVRPGPYPPHPGHWPPPQPPALNAPPPGWRPPPQPPYPPPGYPPPQAPPPGYPQAPPPGYPPQGPPPAHPPQPPPPGYPPQGYPPPQGPPPEHPPPPGYPPPRPQGQGPTGW